MLLYTFAALLLLGIVSNASAEQHLLSSLVHAARSFVLLGDSDGAAGFKARVNQHGFEYTSTLGATIFDQQLRSVQITNISNCQSETKECVDVYNLKISTHQCPHIVLHPAPPNQIVLAVENLDIGLTGNVGGKNGLTGSAKVDVKKLSLNVTLAVDRTSKGGAVLKMNSCKATIESLNVDIQGGGSLGDSASVKDAIASEAKKRLTSELCAQLPDIINQQVNSILSSIPQTLALTPILDAASNAYGVDLSKLKDIHLNIELLQSHATSNDFTIELKSDFSPKELNGAPHPMVFPSAVGTKMGEALISDYTINSLLYNIHEAGATLTIGPDTPFIGPRMLTKNLERTSKKYPEVQTIVASIRTTQAPFIQLSDGGVATIDLNAVADVYIGAAKEPVDTVTITAKISVTTQTDGSKLSGKAVAEKIEMIGKTGAIVQEDLTYIAHLAKVFIMVEGNERLQKGITISVPPGIAGLPLTFVDPEVRIVEHAAWVASDFVVDLAGLQKLMGLSASAGDGSCAKKATLLSFF